MSRQGRRYEPRHVAEAACEPAGGGAVNRLAEES